MTNVAAQMVGLEEWLARFVTRRAHVRSDHTVKPDVFIPYRHTELSVTRHLALSEEEIWGVGNDVAQQIGQPLLGRADAEARLYMSVGLTVLSQPVEGNPNHANVVGWPPGKTEQKELALLIARDASYRPVPQE